MIWLPGREQARAARGWELGHGTGYGPVKREMGPRCAGGAVSKLLPAGLTDEPDVGCWAVESRVMPKVRECSGRTRGDARSSSVSPHFMK